MRFRDFSLQHLTIKIRYLYELVDSASAGIPLLSVTIVPGTINGTRNTFKL